MKGTSAEESGNTDIVMFYNATKGVANAFHEISTNMSCTHQSQRWSTKKKPTDENRGHPLCKCSRCSELVPRETSQVKACVYCPSKNDKI